MARRPLTPGAVGDAPRLIAAVPARMLDRLDELVRQRGITRSEFVRQAIDDALDREARTA
jgi:metal-responsive CopG/Arc/MetJ family transcriptional regulator